MQARRFMKCARRMVAALGDVLAKGGSGEYYAGTSPGLAPWVRTGLPWGTAGEPHFFPQDDMFLMQGADAWILTPDMKDWWMNPGVFVPPADTMWHFLRGCMFILQPGRVGLIRRLSGESFENSAVVFDHGRQAGYQLTIGSCAGDLLVLGETNAEGNSLLLARTADLGETWSDMPAPMSAFYAAPLAGGRICESRGCAYALVDAAWPLDGGQHASGYRLWRAGASGGWDDITPDDWFKTVSGPMDAGGYAPEMLCAHLGAVVVLVMRRHNGEGWEEVSPRFHVRTAGGSWQSVALDMSGLLGELEGGAVWRPDAPVFPDRWTGYATSHPFRIEPVSGAFHATARWRGWLDGAPTGDTAYVHGHSADGVNWEWETFTPEENDDTWHFWAGRYNPNA